jgi:hypothetical protein
MVQVPSIKTSALGMIKILQRWSRFELVPCLAEAAVGISDDEAQKLYNFVYVITKLKILGLTEDHIL